MLRFVVDVTYRTFGLVFGSEFNSRIVICNLGPVYCWCQRSSMNSSLNGLVHCLSTNDLIGWRDFLHELSENIVHLLHLSTPGMMA